MKLQPYKQYFIAMRQNQKLSLRYCEKNWIDNVPVPVTSNDIQPTIQLEINFSFHYLNLGR